MNPKTDTAKDQPENLMNNSLAELQQAGFGNMMSMGTVWMEAMSDMGAEVIGFVAERIKEDVKTQHKILHCKDTTQLQHIQAEFFQKALEQYQDETGKLVEMSSVAFTTIAKAKT